MEPYNDGWLYSGSARDRLWNKSAIGKKINNNQLLLSSSEVIFCHNHRHIDWPNNEWFAKEIIKNGYSLLDNYLNSNDLDKIKKSLLKTLHYIKPDNETDLQKKYYQIKEYNPTLKGNWFDIITCCNSRKVNILLGGRCLSYGGNSPLWIYS